MPKYYMPTILLTGKNCVKRHPRHLIHGKKCMIITGRNSAKISGALDDVTDVLNENNIKYYIYDQITIDTRISEIYSIGKLMKQFGAEFVIGIGGGTVLDVAKTAAVYAANDIEPMQIYDEVYPNKPLKVVCIPTTAGTGSDTTQYVMLTLDDDFRNKRSFSSSDCFPYSTFLDSRYTMTLPLDVTRNTAIDALCHAVESYLNVQASAFSDIVALKAINLIGSCANALMTGEITENDREKLLVAASSGGMAVAHTGLNIVHAMGHQLTCDKNIPHGRANAALLVEFISWMARKDIMRAVKVVSAFDTDLNSLKKFIEVVAPINEEITEKDIDRWLKYSITDTVKQNCPREFTEEDERMIFYNALINKERDYKSW